MVTVTALRWRGTRVSVELDGRRWRTLPVDAVVEAGLAVGVELRQERVRALVRALSRQRATEVTLRSLARRDRSRAEVEAQLERAGVRQRYRQDVLERASGAGLVDDGRFAMGRAGELAERGAGDRLVRDDLARRGVSPETTELAVAQLEPESSRAARIIAVRGRSVRTLRYLGSRGFAQESLDDLIAELENRALP